VRVLLLLALALSGCAVPSYDPTAVDGSGDVTAPGDEPGAACLANVPPCIGVAYCDELGASEQPACGGVADGSCRRWASTAGLSCFPSVDGSVGFCDDEGMCR
jgi:hypothetical protein